jgi:hypothetical protein
MNRSNIEPSAQYCEFANMQMCKCAYNFIQRMMRLHDEMKVHYVFANLQMCIQLYSENDEVPNDMEFHLAFAHLHICPLAN